MEGIKMSKKDYKLIAQAIADTWCDAEAQKLIAESLAESLASDNPNFDKSKFLTACGVN
jgi:hypothetical protein